MTEEKKLELLTEVLDECIKIIYKKTKDNFEGKERLNFIMECCINLTGNVCAQNVKEELESFKAATTTTIIGLMKWFDAKINHLESLQKSH